MTTYRENMSADELAAFMNEINQLNACYESAAKNDRITEESQPFAGFTWKKINALLKGKKHD